MAIQHFLGYGDASKYLDTLMKTKSYEQAQQVVNQSILNRLKKSNPNAVLPKNDTVVEYLSKFNNKIDNVNQTPKKIVNQDIGPTIKASQGKDINNPLNTSVQSNNTKITTPVLPNKLPDEKLQETKNSLKTQIKKSLNIDATDNQLDILLSDKPWTTKMLELKVVKPYTSVQDLNKFQVASAWAKRAAVKQGLAKPDETEEVKSQVKYKSDVQNTGVSFLGEVKGDNSNYATFYNKFDRNTGFAYIPIANVGKSDSKTEYNNVKGIAHFILDSDATDDYKHPYSQNYMKKQLNNQNIAPGSTVEDQFLPTREKTKDGKVIVKYKKVSELEKDDYVMAPLRQYKFTDINWDGSTEAEGFKSSIKALPTKTGEQTYFIFPSGKNGKSSYGKYGGGSVVFLANGKNFAIDFAGSINDIKTMAEQIIKEEKIEPEDLIIGYHDLGSFSAKPKAVNNKLKFNQWVGFNNESHTGGGLAFPAN
jgi:hypothetical protein